jgi:hypothetical protein
MRKSVLLGVLFMLQVVLHAHNMNYSMPALRTWTNTVTGEQLQGSFLIQKSDGVLVQDINGVTHTFPLNSLSADDQQWLAQRSQWIHSVNAQILAKENSANENDTNASYLWVFYLLVAAALGALLFARKQSIQHMVWPALLVVLGFTWSGFTQWKDVQLQMDTDPTLINEAFNPFVPAVHTFFDTDYFYVESRGIPETHEMMVGISNHGWQQQVPIPQCYIGNNSWPIPLHPVIAANPIPVDATHFTRGAIAIAVNGVPIFNVHTNTGVDSFVDGQLDIYGGHCGRADDYHYHIAPLHLYDYTSSSLPIAYGLDGFAVYGSTEPDGSPMQALDANHGHFGTDGVYHYHGTAEAPYMIANMVGEVTEDNTNQLIPQAAAHPVRPSLTPLNGALINMCVPNAAGNGYTLGYLLNGQQDSIAYSWDNSGNYSFNYYTTGDGVANTQVYTGFDQCIVPVNVHESNKSSSVFEVFPNPCHNEIQVKITSGNCHEIRVYAADGCFLKSYLANQLRSGAIDMTDCPQGNYYFECLGSNGTSVQKVIKQ